MKSHPLKTLCLAALFVGCGIVHAQDYTYFVRQIQMPDEAEWDVSVDQSGSQQSPLAINPNGARFELWTVRSNPLTSYLLDTTYVNSYIPVASVSIVSEDPYSVIPRTRADRPFEVKITVNGMSLDPTAPEAARTVKLLRHVQAYAGNDNGTAVNRANASLISQGSLDSNGEHTLSYPVTSIPGGDRTKVRGEERFSVFSVADYQAPESQLSSKFVQIWPMADGSIHGLSAGDVIKGKAPNVQVRLNDLYPDSFTFVQVYEGSPQLGVDGDRVPGSSILVDSSVPRSENLVLKDWDKSIESDGTWTLEVITITPFGTDRLNYLSFEVDRAIKVNGSVTSVD
ncbi:MAG: hypothetical protein GXX91_02530 [Verrucomicrobiaceae bacterium]|nr:hypothetical protein [Verrucomicrobiaceae bacterium]